MCMYVRACACVRAGGGVIGGGGDDENNMKNV